MGETGAAPAPVSLFMWRLFCLTALLLSPLPAGRAASLTDRFEDDLATQEWTMAYSGERPAWQPPGQAQPLPLQFILSDAASGEQARLEPLAHYTADHRHRWGGRTLGVDWLLVLDGATTGVLTVSGQFESTRLRLLQLEAGATPVPGEVAWRAENDPREPRLHQLLDHSENPARALRYTLALDPESTNRPGRTTFRFFLRTQPEEVPAATPDFQPEDEEMRSTLERYVQAQARGEALQAVLPTLPPRPGGVPLFATPLTTHVVTLEPTARVEVAFHNHGARSQQVHLRAHAEPEGPGVTITLQAGESRLETIELAVEETPPGGYILAAEVDGQTVLEIPLTLTRLDEGDSLARDSQVRVEVDSTLSGYTRHPLTDGLTDVGAAPASSWASDETESEHWVRFNFPQPTAVSELRLFWAREDERIFTSRRGEAIGWTAAGERVHLAVLNLDREEADTTLSFDTLQLAAVEWRQPRGGGSVHRPNLLWLNELEVR